MLAPRHSRSAHDGSERKADDWHRDVLASVFIGDYDSNCERSRRVSRGKRLSSIPKPFPAQRAGHGYRPLSLGHLFYSEADELAVSQCVHAQKSGLGQMVFMCCFAQKKKSRGRAGQRVRSAYLRDPSAPNKSLGSSSWKPTRRSLIGRDKSG